MTGTYIWAAIPPYCGEIRRRVEVVEWLGDRVMLRELDNPSMMIDCPLDSFQPDIPTEIESEQVLDCWFLEGKAGAQ